MRIARIKTNQQQLRYFAAAICGLMAVFIVSHWLRAIFNKKSPSSGNYARRISRYVGTLYLPVSPVLLTMGQDCEKCSSPENSWVYL